MRDEIEKLIQKTGLLDSTAGELATKIADLYEAKKAEAVNHALEVPRVLSLPMRLIRAELDRAYTKHGREPWGRHEFYGIFKEEVDEVWDDIKKDAPQQRLLKEVVQAGAMCVRYLETGDRRLGPHVLYGV